jgi:high-affinity iron transporter
MLQISLVIFRELLEIALLLVLIYTANASRVKNFHYYLLFGSLIGVLGAGALAFATPYLGSMFDDLGQEIFNSLIIFLTAGMIAFTIIYMRNYSKTIQDKMANVGGKVSESLWYKIVLVLLIAVTIFREGAEIVLFTYSVLLANQLPITSCLAGAAIGFSAAALCSFLFYKGLMKVANFFRITSFLLIFVAAGLVSEGWGILNRSGAIDFLSQTAWDSSWLVADDSIIGQVLGVLISYTAKPSILEVLMFVMTFGVIIYFDKRKASNKVLKK